MKITGAIHAVRIPFQIPLAPGRNLERFVYAYILSGEQTILVDSGVAGSEAIIFDYLEAIGKKPVDISLMVLTHAHPDHIGGAKAVKAVTGCRVAAHQAARAWVEDVAQQFQERPVPGFHALVGGSVKIDHLLADGDRIDPGGFAGKVIHIPGHSECSIALFCEEQGVLFAGDAIPQGNDLPIYDDAALAVGSIRKLQRLAGIRYLLASWADPRPKEDPYQIMAAGLAYIQKIHAAVRAVADREAIKEPMILCRKVVDRLGLPEVALNPIVARSFASHLPRLDQEKL